MKINLKGIPWWDGKTFQTAGNDLLVDRDQVEDALKCSLNVLVHAQESVKLLQDALGGEPN